MPFDSRLIQNVYASGLVKSETLGRILEKLRPSQTTDASLARAFAGELLQSGFLSSWQLTQLQEGRTKFTLGPYRMIDSLGRGGYSHVFLAQTQDSRQFVAVKVLSSSKVTPEIVDRFKRETEIQRQFRHENLVRVLDFGEDGGLFFAVHEYMDAGDAKQRIHRELQLPIETAARLILDVAEGLAALHQRGIVHCDVKPANILLNQEGTAKLTDFGFFCFLSEEAAWKSHLPMLNTPSGKLVGTADYMAPDHILFPSIPSPLWDIYSLGCTFYQALTGIVPFPKGDSRQKIIAHVRSEPMDVRIFRQDLPHGLAKILMEMMAKAPQKRISCAEEVAERLRYWLQNRPRSADEIFRVPEIPDFSVPNTEEADVSGMARLEEMDLTGLKSETMDFSSIRFPSGGMTSEQGDTSEHYFVTLPGQEQPLHVQPPPVLPWEEFSQNPRFRQWIKPLWEQLFSRKQDDHDDHIVYPLILFATLLFLIGIFIFLLILAATL
ncbi:MAG: serine/threonine protein kinase [Planctomycetaceae bacterium]|nr:serine/threonine protein kinase [Planctomycetaceae bacterium]